MKKGFFILTIAFLLFANGSQAQTYKTSAGITIDFGDGSTLVGPAIKHFFSAHDAIQGEILFGNNATYLQAFYQYNAQFSSGAGLNWYLGVGPSIGLYDGGSSFYVRPVAGLDYKVTNAPLSLSFDWRPSIYIGYGADFEPTRFGIGMRYIFN